LAMFVQVLPLFVLTCHCALGVGTPVAAAVKVTELPADTVSFTGSMVTTGAVSTVRVAAFVVAWPAEFV
jgi:hypothetical protein